MQYEPPAFEPPFRIMLLAAATDGWYAARDESARERLLRALTAWVRGWEDDGATLLASFDDDLFMVGQPAPIAYSIYVLYEVDELGLVVRRLAALRDERDGVRLDAAFRVEARVGRPLFLLSL
jgi:hypothetical protein